ncbi:23878_t:CDS:1, partial [Gigaspora margarita]
MDPRMDAIFRIYNDVEFEVAKSYKQTTLLMNSYKLENVLKDIQIQLCKEIKNEVPKSLQIWLVGMITG